MFLYFSILVFCQLFYADASFLFETDILTTTGVIREIIII